MPKLTRKSKSSNEMSTSVEELIKDRRKSRRRSSLVACEALKQMNIDGTFDEQPLSDTECLFRLSEIGLKWIESKLRDFQAKSSVTSKLAAKTTASLASNTFLNFDPSKDYELLSDEHKQFLKSVSISEDEILRVLKNKHRELIKVSGN